MRVVPHISTLAQQESGGFLRWLLGLREIDPAGGEAVLGWRYPLPAWAWVLIVVGVLGLGWIGYRRLLGRRAGRVTLGLVRAAVVLLIAVLLAQPVLVLPREHTEADHVLMLVDRSESLTVLDAPPVEGSTNRRSRDEQLRAFLTGHAPLWRKLGEEHRLDWMAFAEQPVPIGSPADLGEPAGDATALRTAIDEALRTVSGKPLSAVVLFSDGRSGEPIGSDTLARLQRLDVPIFAVPLGAAEPMDDLSLERIDAPDRAFVNDVVPVLVTVGGPGLSRPPPGTTLKLIDTTTRETLDEQPVEKLNEPVRLLHTPKTAGRATWELQLTSPEPELSVVNNFQSLDLTFDDRPIRVLYVEGYPRWEYRYLTTLLKREESIDSSVMLLSADRTFNQEGDTPLRRLPQTAQELAPYDVIAIGDVPANYFTAEQARLIHDQVSIHGAGLMFIAGPDEMPISYAASPLATLLPISVPSAVTLLTPPIHLKPTSQSRSLGVLYLRSPRTPEDQAGWPEGDLQPLVWAQSIGDLKPATEVLAEDANSSYPLLVRMRFGAGQSMYLATDEIWRWRKPWGELYVDQFWTQLFRLLARGRLESGAGDRAVLTVSHRRAATGDTLSLELTIRDQTLLDSTTPSVEVSVTPVADRSVGPRSARQRAESVLVTATDRPGVYRGTWSPRSAGRMSLAVASAALSDLGLERIVDVVDAQDEMRYPITDHALLARLAEETGGAVIPGGQLAQLESKIKNRARMTTADITEPLTRSPLVFAVLLLLLTVEWIGRKMLGLA